VSPCLTIPTVLPERSQTAASSGMDLYHLRSTGKQTPDIADASRYMTATPSSRCMRMRTQRSETGRLSSRSSTLVPSSLARVCSPDPVTWNLRVGVRSGVACGTDEASPSALSAPTPS